MKQETRKPGGSVEPVCRRHGNATSLLFRWRVQFGLTARKAPQLATVALADRAANGCRRSLPCAIAAAERHDCDRTGRWTGVQNHLPPVERFFALITERKIRRGIYQSVAALRAEITSFIANHNADPTPFRWTKSADAFSARSNVSALTILQPPPLKLRTFGSGH